MANWNLPTLSSLVADVLSILKERDVDTARMFREQPTNPVDGMIRYNRSQNRFEEYNASTSTWVPLLVAVSGGGTGASTAADARNNLGVKSMGTQESNNVSISGGTISGLSSLSVSGSVSAGTFSGSGSGLTNVPNSATSATNLNSPNTIVLRDSSGNFSAGTITASLNGNANTVTNGVYTTGSYDNPSWLTGLSANKLNSGTVADARLSSNIPKKNDTSVSWTSIHTSSYQPMKVFARGDNVTQEAYIISAGETISPFSWSDNITVPYSQDPNNVIQAPISGTNCYITASGLYLITTHITLYTSSSTNVTFRIRIFAGNTYDGEDQIVARAETFVPPSDTHVVLACAGVAYVDPNKNVGVKVYADKDSQMRAYAGQKSNLLTICKLW